jgi:hypothetical protein
MNWVKPVNLILTDTHYTAYAENGTEGSFQIDHLKNNMNRNRSHYDWNHLEELK